MKVQNIINSSEPAAICSACGKPMKANPLFAKHRTCAEKEAKLLLKNHDPGFIEELSFVGKLKEPDLLAGKPSSREKRRANWVALKITEQSLAESRKINNLF